MPCTPRQGPSTSIGMLPSSSSRSVQSLIDYEIVENGLKEIARMPVGPEDLLDRLIEGRKGTGAADVQE